MLECSQSNFYCKKDFLNHQTDAYDSVTPERPGCSKCTFISFRTIYSIFDIEA